LRAELDDLAELVTQEPFDGVEEAKAVFDAVGLTEQPKAEGSIRWLRAARPRPERIGAKSDVGDGGVAEVVERAAGTGEIPVDEGVRAPIGVHRVLRAQVVVADATTRCVTADRG